MGWLKEKYTEEYFIGEDKKGNKLPYGVYGVKYWKDGDLYPEAKRLLEYIDLKNATILDIGFGRGEAVKYCVQRGAKLVIGVDFSEAALGIAQITCEDQPSSNYKLYCQDILEFLNDNSDLKDISHILMLDVIEHIPRSEVEELLPILYQILLPGGCLIIHTPFYVEDNDIIHEGLKLSTQDSSDQHDETNGMHINRYSAKGLKNQVEKYGFFQWSNYIFIKPKNKFPIWKHLSIMRSFVARKLKRGV